jgi:signal transduction histidine kinase
VTEAVQQPSRYIPDMRTKFFYAWSFVLIVAPALVQAFVVACVCFGLGICAKGGMPWIILAVLFVPGAALAHWTIKRIVREEAQDLKAAIEREPRRPLEEKRLRIFYALPQKIVWVSLPVAVVLLFPVTFSAFTHLDGAAAFAMLAVPLSAFAMLAAVFCALGENAIQRIGRFLPPVTAPSRISGSLARWLAVMVLLTVGGFAVALACVAALEMPAESRGRLLVHFLLGGGAAAGLFTAALFHLGRVTGRDLKRISGYFDTLFAIESDKTISGIKVMMPARVPASDLKDLWTHTKDVMAMISSMRRFQAEAIEGMVQNQKMKTLFLASMSHDLKSPLNSIIGFSELLLKGIEGELNDAQREDIQLIHDSGEELLGIINSVLDFSRLEAGTLEIHREWTPSIELITGAVKSGSHMIGGKDITIQTEIQPGLPPVYVDPSRISQVLYSLINNAIKFMDKGTITVKVALARGLFEDADRYLRIDVVDTGMGIKQADIERIFDSFRQVDSSFSRRSSGIGLGLSLAKELIDVHNGKIWVESEVGRGSVFTVGLPLERMD